MEMRLVNQNNITNFEFFFQYLKKNTSNTSKDTVEQNFINDPRDLWCNVVNVSTKRQ